MPTALYGKPNFFGDTLVPSSSASEPLNVSLVGFEDAEDKAILEFLYKVTNAPADALSEKEAALVALNKAALNGKIWCVSVGDVFCIDGRCYVCDSCGWYPTSEEAAKAYFDLPADKRGGYCGKYPVPKGFENPEFCPEWYPPQLLVNRKLKDRFVLELEAV